MSFFKTILRCLKASGIAQARDKFCAEGEHSAEKIANWLLSEARSLRTKDNTSLIFLDFDRVSNNSCKVDS